MATNETRLSPLRAVLQNLEPRSDEVIGDFYNRLFAARPEYKALFESTDWPKQRRMLLGSLVLALENLEEPEAVRETLRGFGRTHEPFKLSLADYRQFGALLRDALAEHSGDAWTPEVEKAWWAAYDELLETMFPSGL